MKDNRPSWRYRCPKCKVGRLIAKWSGVKCNKCPYWDCA